MTEYEISQCFVAVKGLILNADKGLIDLMYVLVKALGRFLFLFCQHVVFVFFFFFPNSNLVLTVKINPL